MPTTKCLIILTLFCLVYNTEAKLNKLNEYLNIFPDSRVQRAMEEECDNAPDNENGTCVLLDTCPSIRKLIDDKKPLRKETVQLLLRVHCGFLDRLPMVCCSDPQILDTTEVIPPFSQVEDNNNTRPSDLTTSSNSIHKNIALLPLDRCGYFSSDRFLLPPNVIDLSDVRPTLARLNYEKGSESSYRCGGSLISARYVLTAAHCVTDLPRGVTLKWVILGEFAVDTDPDCINERNLGKWCSQPIQKMAVDKVLVHPQYRAASYLHDLALIRLKQPVQYLEETELIPLCLPVANVTYLSHIKENWMKISGWGTLKNGTSPLINRMYGILSPVDISQCRTQLKDKVKVTDSHLCGVGTGVKDSSIGDSGGPLMVYGALGKDEGPRLIQIGVETFTPSTLSFNSTGLPNVYTSVTHHLTWILDNLQP